MTKKNIRLEAVLRWCRKKDAKRPSFIKEYSQNCHAVYRRKRRETDLKFSLRGRIDSLIRRSLKGNRMGTGFEKLLPYNLRQLKRYLGKTMPVGYTWKDFQEGRLHIDHIFPVSIFNFTSPEDIGFRRCWALDNLQLLPALENREKSDRVTEAFQLLFDL